MTYYVADTRKATKPWPEFPYKVMSSTGETLAICHHEFYANILRDALIMHQVVNA